MEPLIVALILMAISAFFSNKKKSEDAPPAKKGRPAPGGRTQGGFKRMEDYAKEIYGEFQAQMNPEAEKKEQVKEAAKDLVERQTNRRPERPAAAVPVAAKEIGGRLSAHQKPGQAVRKKLPEEQRSPFPLTQSEAQKGIILAEVFMPPKAKRK